MNIGDLPLPPASGTVDPSASLRELPALSFCCTTLSRNAPNL